MLALAVLDIDGTLVDSSGLVKDQVWQMIDKAQGAGMQFAVCTGRPGEGVAARIAKRLSANGPHIFQSGAVISNADGKVVKAFGLNESIGQDLVRLAREHNLALEMYSPNQLFVERQTPKSTAHAKVLGVTPVVQDLLEVIHNEPIVRAQWVVSPEDLSLLEALELTNIEQSSATTPALPDTLFISLTPKGVSKGSAVTALAEHLQIPLDNIMAVGDSQGDVSMLEVVGHPIVMGNSPDWLKERFPNVGDVEDLGIVSAIHYALNNS